MRNSSARSSFGHFSLAFAAFAWALAACSGSSDNASSGSSGASSGSSGASSGSTPSCVCNVEENGVAQAITCGEQSCVNSVSYTCGSTGDIGRGGACTAPKPSDGGTGGGDGSVVGGPLTCLSYTWCGSGTVKQYNGQTLPTTRGGIIADGLYREAYILAEKGTGTTFGDYGGAFLFRNGSARELGSLGRVGTFTTTATTLSIAYASNCDDQSGKTTSASMATDVSEYFVDAQGQLFLFYKSTGSSGTQTVAHVYKPQAKLCANLPQSVPATPGDSYTCNVTNCGCTEASNGPAEPQTCKFVHGG